MTDSAPEPVVPVHDQGAPVLVDDLLAELPSRKQRRTIVPTSFHPLDDALGGGLRTGTLTLIGGIPGVGKTVAALQWARNIALREGGALYVCYEHDESALLGRLLLGELGELAAEENTPSTREMRAMLWSLANAEVDLGEAAAGNLLVRAAYSKVREFSQELWLQAASGARTRMEDIADLLDAHHGERTVLFVDYLQKVPGDPGRAAVALKDLAVEHDIAIVAVVAGAESSLHRRRFRAQHLQSAAALTYEADVILILNDKFASVSKRHTAYDPVRAETFRQQIVLSIEKNRAGPTGLNLEFTKDFVHYRFDPFGSYVEEKLVDDLIFTD